MIRLLACAILWASLASSVGAAQPPEPMPVDQAFEQLKTYDYGQNDKALRVLELHVVRSATDAARTAQVAERLAAILAEPQTPYAAKVFICQQLLVVGTEAQVPQLAKMLDDPQTAEIARFTLEALPGEASAAALRKAASRLTGTLQLGALNSLGQRRDAGMLASVAQDLRHADATYAAVVVEMLGKIGTEAAAALLAKSEVPTAAVGALHNAQLQAAERRLAAGDRATATALYQQVWSSKRLSTWRLAGLTGLVRAAPDQATALVLEALAADDPFVQATAMRLTRDLPGPSVTAALLTRLDHLDPAGQASLLGVLGERGDRAAAAAVTRRLESPDDAVRVAALLAMAKLGDATIADRLAQIAAAASGAVQQAARASLVRLTGPDSEPKLLALAGAGEPLVRAEVIRALAARRSTAAAPVLLMAATDAHADVRAAAWDALAIVAPADSYGKLVQLLTAATVPADAEAAERAVLATGGRIEDAADRTKPVIAALAGVPAPVRPSLLRVLSGLGGPDALAAVRPHLSDADATIRDAAVRAVAKWPDASAAGDLLQIARDSDQATHRTLALRGYLRLASDVKDETARLKTLEQVRPIARSAAAKRLLLAVLADVADPGALHIAASFLDDAEVAAEAAAATLKTARGLVRTDAAAVRGAMKRLLDTTRDTALADQAAAIDEEAMKAPSPGAGQVALQRDQKRSDAQKATLARRPPAGYRLACYLDCGPDTVDGVKGGPLLSLVSGTPYFWNDSDQLADARFGSVAFDGARVTFEVTGLHPQRKYQIGFSWWDFDHATRAQSVWGATGKGERESKLLDRTALPSGTNKQGPEVKTLALPAELHAAGSLRLVFRNEGTPNVVVSELWLWESAQ